MIKQKVILNSNATNRSILPVQDEFNIIRKVSTSKSTIYKPIAEEWKKCNNGRRNT